MPDTFGDGPHDAEHTRELKRELNHLMNRFAAMRKPSKFVGVCALAGLLRDLMEQYPANTAVEVRDTIVIPFLRHDPVEKSTIITLH